MREILSWIFMAGGICAVSAAAGYDIGFRQATRLSSPWRNARPVRALAGDEVWIAAPSDELAAEILILNSRQDARAVRTGGET